MSTPQIVGRYTLDNETNLTAVYAIEPPITVGEAFSGLISQEVTLRELGSTATTTYLGFYTEGSRP